MIKVRVARQTAEGVRFFNSCNIILGADEVRAMPDFELIYDADLNKKQRREALRLITKKVKGVVVFPKTYHDKAAGREGFHFEIDTSTDYVKVRLKGAGVVIDRVIVTRQGRLRSKVEKAKEQMLMGVI